MTALFGPAKDFDEGVRLGHQHVLFQRRNQHEMCIFFASIVILGRISQDLDHKHGVDDGLTEDLSLRAHHSVLFDGAAGDRHIRVHRELCLLNHRVRRIDGTAALECIAEEAQHVASQPRVFDGAPPIA